VKNLIRQQVIKLRQHNGWTQEDFAVRLQHAGWHNATRSTVSKIEGGSICIPDYDLLIVAAALRVSPIHLFPKIDWQRPMDETIHQFISDEKHALESETQPATPPVERLAYSVQEAADLLGVNYFSVYRLIQRGKLKVSRVLRGKLLVPRSELLKLLETE
jgi:excisionase family DNA binding protein